MTTMSEPKKKRTSRKKAAGGPASNIVNSLGNISAAPDAVVDHVRLPLLADPAAGVRMRVASGAKVIAFSALQLTARTDLEIDVQANAVVTQVDVRAVADMPGAADGEPRFIVIHEGAVVERTQLSPGTDGDSRHVGINILERAQVVESDLRLDVAIGARTKIYRSSVYSSVIGNDCSLDSCALPSGSKVGDGCQLEGLRPSFPITIGDGAFVSNGVWVKAKHIGSRSRLLGANEVGEDAVIFNDCELGVGTSLGADSQLDDRVTLGEDVWIGKKTRVGADAKIGPRCRIQDEVKIGAVATIGDSVSIEKYAVVDPGIEIGDGAVIGSGTRVRKHVAAGEVVRTAAESLASVTVHANAEGWMLGRVADVMEAAGQKRLDKRVLQKEMPTLVETHCVKQLLRMAPPPDVATLREMAEEFACTPKYTGEKATERKRVPEYVASVKPKGWSGMQVMGDYDNDVVIFKTTPEVLRSIVPEWTTPDVAGSAPDRPWQVGFLRALMTLGKTDSHPGGEDPYVVGWARVRFDEEYRSVLCEELQTDLAFLAWDPSMEVWYLAGQSERQSMGGASVGFMIADEIAKTLTAEGVAASHWEEHVREMVAEGRIQRPTGVTPTAILPTFTKDKAAQQKALMALAFWNSDISAGAPEYAPEVEFTRPFATLTGKMNDTAPVYRWVAIAVLGQWSAFMKRASAMSSRHVYALKSPELLPIIERAQREWPVEAAKIIEDVRGLFSDFYESALAGVLQLARQAGMKEVWVPDYETKYAIASYAGGEGSAPMEPPRSVYTELPKKFGVAQAQILPGYMDVGRWREEARDRRSEKWPRVEIPDHPRGRRLFTNPKRTSRP